MNLFIKGDKEINKFIKNIYFKFSKENNQKKITFFIYYNGNMVNEKFKNKLYPQIYKTLNKYLKPYYFPTKDELLFFNEDKFIKQNEDSINNKSNYKIFKKIL